MFPLTYVQPRYIESVALGKDRRGTPIAMLAGPTITLSLHERERLLICAVAKLAAERKECGPKRSLPEATTLAEDSLSLRHQLDVGVATIEASLAS